MKSIVPSVLLITLIASLVAFSFIPEKVAPRYGVILLEWLVSLWKWWGISFLFFLMFSRFGTKFDYSQVSSFASVFHWRNFPANWRELGFVFLLFAFYLLFFLTIGYLSRYGEGH